MNEHQQDAEMQEIPVKVYRTDERVVIAVPMPGLEPQDIGVTVEEGGRLRLQGELRGTLKDEKEVLIDEWTPGPYFRELQLPDEVDGPHANLTYNNGVLVVVLPVSEQTTPAQLEMETVTATHGARVGHTGRDAKPASGGVPPTAV